MSYKTARGECRRNGARCPSCGEAAFGLSKLHISPRRIHNLTQRNACDAQNKGPDPPEDAGILPVQSDPSATPAECKPEVGRLAVPTSVGAAGRSNRGRSPRVAAGPVAKKLGKMLQSLDGFPPCGKCFDHWKPLRGIVDTWLEDTLNVIAQAKTRSKEREHREQKGPSRPKAPLPQKGREADHLQTIIPSPESVESTAPIILETCLARGALGPVWQDSRSGCGPSMSPALADQGAPQHFLNLTPEPHGQAALRETFRASEFPSPLFAVDGFRAGTGNGCEARNFLKAKETILEKSEKFSLAKAEAAACSSGPMEILTRIAQDYTTMRNVQAEISNCNFWPYKRDSFPERSMSHEMR